MAPEIKQSLLTEPNDRLTAEGSAAFIGI